MDVAQFIVICYATFYWLLSAIYIVFGQNIVQTSDTGLPHFATVLLCNGFTRFLGSVARGQQRDVTSWEAAGGRRRAAPRCRRFRHRWRTSPTGLAAGPSGATAIRARPTLRAKGCAPAFDKASCRLLE